MVNERHTLHTLDEEWWGDVAGEGDAKGVLGQPAEPKIWVSYPLAIRATLRGRVIEAELLDEQGRIRLDGVEYGSPSGAGKAATGWKAVDGWFFWKYEHPDTGEWRAIDDLRAGKG